MKLRSEETTPVSFKHVFDVLNDFSYKRQACVFSRTGTASLPAYRKVKASGADSPGLGSQARLQRKRQRLNAFISLQIPSPVCFQGGFPKVHDLTFLHRALHSNSQQACKPRLEKGQYGYWKNICLEDGGGCYEQQADSHP